MRALPWVLAGVGVGLAAAYMIMDQPRMQAETGWDSIEESAARTFGWGSKARVSGAGTNLGGKVKEGLGRVTGNADLENEGVGDQAIGSMKDAAGTVAQAAGKTLHDLNR